MRCTLLLATLLAVTITLASADVSSRLNHRIHTNQPSRPHNIPQPHHPHTHGPIGPLYDGNCTNAFDVSISSVSTNTFACLLAAGYQQVTVPIARVNCTLDTSVIGSVKSAFEAGLGGVDLVLIPAPASCKLGPQQQVAEAIASFQSAHVQINRLWFDVTVAASPAGWQQNNCPANRQFLGPAIRHAARQLGAQRVGIRTSVTDWQTLVCADNEYAIFSLWYERHDGVNNMNEWATSNFGGWRVPLIKQYSAPATVCGISINSDVRRNNVC